METIHYNILDTQRIDILPLLKSFTDRGFYLAGGTALALQIGHRDSIDFDFFTESPIDTTRLFDEVLRIFSGHNVVKVQEEHNTLGIIVDERIKISFMYYPYELLKPYVVTEYLNLASIADIACMKCSAITSRSVEKDYVDMYFILQEISLVEIITLCQVKYPSIDTNLILKSLVYFDDVEHESIIYKENHDTDFETIKQFLRKVVR